MDESYTFDCGILCSAVVVASDPRIIVRHDGDCIMDFKQLSTKDKLKKIDALVKQLATLEEELSKCLNESWQPFVRPLYQKLRAELLQVLGEEELLK